MYYIVIIIPVPYKIYLTPLLNLLISTQTLTLCLDLRVETKGIKQLVVWFVLVRWPFILSRYIKKNLDWLALLDPNLAHQICLYFYLYHMCNHTVNAFAKRFSVTDLLPKFSGL